MEFTLYCYSTSLSNQKTLHLIHSLTFNYQDSLSVFVLAQQYYDVKTVNADAECVFPLWNITLVLACCVFTTKVHLRWGHRHQVLPEDGNAQEPCINKTASNERTKFAKSSTLKIW